jgi:hypothetical protein
MTTHEMLNTKNIGTEQSLLQIAQEEFNRCKRVIIPLKPAEVPGVQNWQSRIDSDPELDGSGIVSSNYAAYLRATNTQPGNLRHWCRRGVASYIVAANIAAGNEVLSLDPVLAISDREDGSVLNDEQAMASVEESSRKAQAAVKQVDELIKAKDEVEFNLLKLQGDFDVLTAQHKQLQEEVQRLTKALDVSKVQAQALEAQDPVVVAVSSEIKSFKTELKTVIAQVFRERCQDECEKADGVVAFLRMIVGKPAMLEAIKKDADLGPAFKLVETCVCAIPS